jgi:O-Methyltransferase involved in polyketide biosynthesis
VTSLAAENPVSVTAFWVLAARYTDAIGRHPVGNDTYAARFMDDEARAVAQRFASLKRPNASFPVRHRIIDDMLRRELDEDRGRRVAVIGSGFDSRPFRLHGGRWVELDEPALLRHKEARLPVSEAPNELVRVPIRFAEESLEEKLRPFATDDHAIVVLEGVIGYLTDTDRETLLTTLGRLFPSHALICDLLTRTFLRRYGRKLVRVLAELGAPFASSDDAPEALFAALDYRVLEHVSVVQRGVELGARGAPPAFVTRLLPSLRDGYRVWLFEHGTAERD